MTKRGPAMVVREMIDSLTQAAGGAGQMIHHHKDPRWIDAEKLIEKIKEGVIHLATARKEPPPPEKQSRIFIP